MPGSRYLPDDDPLDVGELPQLPTDSSGPIGVPSDYETRPWEYKFAPFDPSIPRRFGETASQELRRGDMTSVSTGKGGDDKWPYYDGDEFFPGQLPPESVAALQRKMAEIGLLSPSTRFRLGVWDDASRKAYRLLLAYANQQGMNYKQALTHMEATGMNFTVDELGNIIPVDQQTRAPLVTQTTDPEELKLVFRKAVIDTLGQGWDQGKIDQMVRSYNDLETKQQRAAYDAELTGGNVVSVPSPEAFITAQATEQDPAAAQGQDMLEYMDDFLKHATSPAWGS